MATDLSNLFNNYIQTYDFDTNKAYPIVGVGSICTADIGLGDPEDSTEQRINNFEKYISTITPTNIPDASHADSADKLGANNMGAENIFIYLKDGTPFACSSTIGNSTTPVYINAGKIEACSEIPSGYELPTADTNELGGIKVGYTSKGENYKVQVDSNGNAYVHVPTNIEILNNGKELTLGAEHELLNIDGVKFTVKMPTVEISGGGDIEDTNTEYSLKFENNKLKLIPNTTDGTSEIDLSSLAINTQNTAGITTATGNSNNYYIIVADTSDSNNGSAVTNTLTPVYCTIDGTMYATDFVMSSDERLKTFHSDVNVDFNKLKEIPKKYFNFNDTPNETKIGTSAQELQKVYPELVAYNDNDDSYHVNYANLSIVALAAIDKLYAEIVELKSKIKELENVKC